MTLFEIDEQIRAELNRLMDSVDEDGCIAGDFSKIEELKAEKVAKIEGIALYYKETIAEAKAIKEEADKLKARADSAQKKADRLKDYLSFVLQSSEVEKFTTSRVKLSFRASEKVIIDDLDKIDDELLVTKTTVDADKAAIKELLKSGKEVAGAHLETNQNIQIK